MRFIDEQGRELPAGEQGEIVGRSAGMMSGYYRLPEKTAEVEWFDGEGNRFIRSGDVGRLDEDGFIVLGDRMKDMIISGGFNIYPSDIEAVLAQHPQVAECAVIGRALRAMGRDPVAYVVARAGAQPDAAELRVWLNERVGKTQRVADLHIAASLPRSGSARCSSAPCVISMCRHRLQAPDARARGAGVPPAGPDFAARYRQREAAPVHVPWCRRRAWRWPASTPHGSSHPGQALASFSYVC